MRRAIGPILSTGVALVVAGVVVANPVVAPSADVRIPAVALSAGIDPSAGMLDEAFLDSIATPPPASTNPFAVLRELFSSLAADATSFGKNAIVDAFVAGVTVVTVPELTSLTTPYFPDVAPFNDVAPPAISAADLVGWDVPEDFSGLAPVTDGPDASFGLTSESFVPTVQQIVSELASDAQYVADELVAAAFAAGALIASEPALIYGTLSALIDGDLDGALRHAVAAVTAPLASPLIVLNALRVVVEKHLTPSPSLLPSLPALPSPPKAAVRGPSASATIAAPAPVTSPTVTAKPESRGHRGGASAVAVPAAAARATAPVGAAAAIRAELPAEIGETATAATEAGKAVPRRKAAAVARDAAEAVGKTAARPARG